MRMLLALLAPVLLHPGCARQSETFLIHAVRAGDPRAIEAAIARGADPNQPGGVNGWTPLMHAIHTNQIRAVRALLDSGARVNARGRSGETPLMMAAGYGYAPIVELLLESGADTRAQMPDGATVFSIAVGGVPDVDRFTLGSCQAATIAALKRKDPGLSLPENIWGAAAKFSAAVAKFRGCPYQ